MFSSKTNKNCRMSKTKNIPFFKWDALEWAGQEKVFLFSKTQISEFSVPERHGSQEVLRLLLNKLNFPTLPVSIFPCSTKNFTEPKRTSREWLHVGGVSSWDSGLGDGPGFEQTKGSGLVPQGTGTVRWFTPSHSRLAQKSPSLHRKCPHFDRSLHKDFGDWTLPRNHSHYISGQP